MLRVFILIKANNEMAIIAQYELLIEDYPTESIPNTEVFHPGRLILIC
jgi:hypothetical protein